MSTSFSLENNKMFSKGSILRVDAVSDLIESSMKCYWSVSLRCYKSLIIPIACEKKKKKNAVNTESLSKNDKKIKQNGVRL